MPHAHLTSKIILSHHLITSHTVRDHGEVNEAASATILPTSTKYSLSPIMRISLAILALFLAAPSAARSSGRPSTSASRRSTSRSRRPPSSASRRRPPPPDEFDPPSDDELSQDIDNYDEYDSEEFEPRPPPRRRPPQQRSRRRTDDSDYDFSPPPRRSSRSRREVVAYNRRRPQPGAFTRGLSAIRDKMPDPAAVKETVLTATKTAQQTTSKLSSNIYREVKGLTSSELEQVMLKATRPDDEPVKIDLGDGLLVL